MVRDHGDIVSHVLGKGQLERGNGDFGHIL
jgi:hypothetical protein